MKISLTLLELKKMGKKGFPVVVHLRDKQKKKRLTFGLNSLPEYWDFERQLPTNSHPDYIYLMQDVVDLKLKIKELERNNITDFKQIEKELKFILNKEAQKIKEDFFAFTDVLLEEMKERNERSNATVYNTAKIQFQKYCKEVSFDEIDYNLLMGFVNQKKIRGLKPATIHNYLRTLRAIYNQAVKRNITQDKKPFEGVFTGLKTRSHRSRKKYLEHDDIVVLKFSDLKGAKHDVRNLFLLQYYFGGQDLKDIYYLKHSDINKKRVYFNRSKVVNGYVFDLLITPDARSILNSYNDKSHEYIFPFRKDYDGYKTFRRRYQRLLIDIQKELNIEVKPLGGNLGIKVTRHTFANMGKRKGIEEDMLRELMGHERDDVDNFYKDKYPEAERDLAQLKIVNNL